jgi:hypothetical protein
MRQEEGEEVEGMFLGFIFLIIFILGMWVGDVFKNN